MLAEVSLGTVSHYINHPDRVSPEKQERIQKAIDQLGFVRNNAAHARFSKVSSNGAAS